MKCRCFLIWCLTLLFSLTWGEKASSQPAGDVQQIRIPRLGRLVDVLARDSAEVLRRRDLRPHELRRSDTLFFEDVVRLFEEVDVYVRFDKAGYRTDVALFTDASLPMPEPAPASLLPTDSLTRGTYEVRHDGIERLGWVEVSLKLFGFAVVKHTKGLFGVEIGGHRVNVNHTSVLFRANGPDSGYVFLQKGDISFPSYPDLSVEDESFWFLRRGQPPVQMTLPAAELARWNDVVTRKASVWRRPLWQRPAFQIAAAAGIGIGGFLAVRAITQDDRRRGNIIQVIARLPR